MRKAVIEPLGDLRLRVVVIAASLAFFALYTLFDLRHGGRESDLLTTRLTTPAFYIEHFDAWFLWGSLVLNALLALACGLLIARSISVHRERRATGAVCATGGTVLLGFAVFGCPGCIMPLFGTLGLAIFANALPLLGLEFKLASLAIVVAALAWVSRHGAGDPTPKQAPAAT